VTLTRAVSGMRRAEILGGSRKGRKGIGSRGHRKQLLPFI